MKNILEQIDHGVLALPQFQRGYVWKRWQVFSKSDGIALQRAYPIGSMLVWKTRAQKFEVTRDQQDLPLGIHELLLDGQQRLTSLYGIVRGKKPDFSTLSQAHSSTYTSMLKLKNLNSTVQPK